VKNIYNFNLFARNNFLYKNKGREAANEALIRDHVKQATLVVTNSKGPGTGLEILDFVVELFLKYYYIFITLYLIYRIRKFFA